MNRFAVFCIACLPLLSFAQIYKSVDENGVVVYSDIPPEDNQEVETVDLPEINRAGPPPDIPAPRPTQAEKQKPAPEVAITAPSPETTIAMGPGNFSVSASVSPPLTSSQKLQLYIDGTATGDPQKGTFWSLTNVFRGAHNLTVSVVDEEGKARSTSEPITVYVLRPSKNFRN